jgi:RND family efflux transporter MFP subunit
MNDLDIHDRNDVIIRDHIDAITRDRQNNPAGDRNFEKAPMQRRVGRRRWGGQLFALGGFLLLSSGLSLGAWRHYSQQQDVMATAEQQRDFVPSLRVATIEASPGTTSVSLPGTTAAFADAIIYARVTGYIDKRNVDIGDRLKKGQELALIDPRPYQAALDQARAQLAHDQAVLKEAQVDLARYQDLVKTKAIPEQQAEDQAYIVEQDKGTVELDQANVEMAQLNVQYTQVIAPFDGVITQRNIDVGSLVQGNANTGTFLFEIMQQDVIRVFVYVPQDAAFGVAPGVDAVVRVPELPDREFPGTVTRIADALQSGTRTLLTEIDIQNPDDALPPGIYCTAELKIPRKTPSFSVPAEAIIFNRNGIQVAVVSNGKAEIRKVNVTRDLGTRVEVDSGINAGDQVILNPPVNLVDGSKVQTRPEATAADR